MRNEFGQTISEVIEQSESQSHSSEKGQVSLKAQREWFSAIASLEQLLLQRVSSEESSTSGLILSSPTPVLSHPTLFSHFQIGIFTDDSLPSVIPFQLPAATEGTPVSPLPPIHEYSLIDKDALGNEQFCLALTAEFSLVMVLGEDKSGNLAFQFSFDPAVIQQVWQRLRSRLSLSHSEHLDSLNSLVETFAPHSPDYRIVMEFSRQLLQNMPNESITAEYKPEMSTAKTSKTAQGNTPPELELLQAFTHEIRTPLTTIRMFTRLLLKRRDLHPDVIKRLEVIDQECTEQINRMELIFRAAELKTQPRKSETQQRTSVSLDQVFQESIPCWKKQAQRRNVELDVVLPKKLPTVVCDPAMLNQVLTGLMESFTRSLPTGGQIRVQITPAGHQLKLQVLSQNPAQAKSNSPFCLNFNSPTVKSLGQLLLFQPETGSLSLNLDVTKNLFQALGGKLIIRQRPQEGEVLTVFLPIDSPSEEDWGHLPCNL